MPTKSYRVIDPNNLMTICSAEGESGTDDCILYIKSYAQLGKCCFRRACSCDWSHDFETAIKKWEVKNS